jgi:D-serine deaminase-like pyridoxal phosphate-dependent protein
VLDYERFRRILAEESLPAALVDLDAVDRNCDVIRDAVGHRRLTLRIASKSVRVPWLLRYLLDREDPFQGLMCFSVLEAAFLADQGFDGLLVAYPVARREEAAAFARLSARGVTAIATVDSQEQLGILAEAARDYDTTIRLCMDIDVSWRPAGRLAHLGVRRSPIRDLAAAQELARAITRESGLVLTSVLAYEAQVAGMRDVNPGSRALDPIRRFIKRRSIPLAATRRQEVVKALRLDGHRIEIVNGGGTGSLHSTSADASVTEVTAGSGFLCSHLFDGYADLPLEPAVFFAIPVVRRSDPGFVTCAGGGYVASGEAGPDRLPMVHLPRGLTPVSIEGFGEVQTPFKTSGSTRLDLGDPVICRHAKAGELAERFQEYLLLRSGRVAERVPTYRGLGMAFL